MSETTLFQPLPQLMFPIFKLFKPKNKGSGGRGGGKGERKKERERKIFCDIAHKIQQQLFLAIPSKHI